MSPASQYEKPTTLCPTPTAGSGTTSSTTVHPDPGESRLVRHLAPASFLLATPVSTVTAEGLPGDKEAKDAALMESGRRVALAGDGVNDAPAPAEADLGIRLGAGIEVTVWSAGVVPLHSGPLEVAGAVRFGRGAVRLERLNAGYNTVALPIAAAGLRGRPGAISALRDCGNHQGRIECSHGDQCAGHHATQSAPNHLSRTSR